MVDEVRALQALVEAESRARQRDNMVFDREIAELKSGQIRSEDAQKAANDKLERKYHFLTRTALIAAGGFGVLVYFLNWLGPTVVRRLIDAITQGGTP